MPPLSIGELTSIISAAIVILTFFIGRSTATKTSGAEQQQMSDKLETLISGTKEIKDGVKEVNRKLDDHTERITKIESSLETKASRESVSTIAQKLESIEKRVSRVEGNCDLHRGIGGSD